ARTVAPGRRDPAQHARRPELDRARSPHLGAQRAAVGPHPGGCPHVRRAAARRARPRSCMESASWWRLLKDGVVGYAPMMSNKVDWSGAPRGAALPIGVFVVMWLLDAIGANTAAQVVYVIWLLLALPGIPFHPLGPMAVLLAIVSFWAVVGVV